MQRLRERLAGDLKMTPQEDAAFENAGIFVSSWVEACNRVIDLEEQRA